MTIIRSKSGAFWKLSFAGFVSAWAVSCTHSPPETQAHKLTNPQYEQPSIGVTATGESALDVSQISAADTGFATPQISPDIDADQLTVEQLQAYADRCAPDSPLPKADIDCSELSLRVKKVFRSDDKVGEALITLDRLSRNGRKNTGQNELTQNSQNLSLSAQGIASGLLDTSSPPPPQEPEAIELDSLLNELGLRQNAGAIIESGG